jgi:hypothetical protein
MADPRRVSSSRTISVTMVHEVHAEGDVRRGEIVARLAEALDGEDLVVRPDAYASVERSHEAKGGSVR